MKALTIDIETRPDPTIDVPEFWTERKKRIEPNGSLKDPIKIAADIDQKLSNQRARMSLSPVTGMIAVIGIADAMHDDEPVMFSVEPGAMTREGEGVMLKRFFRHFTELYDSSTDIVCTYNGRMFDVPFVAGRMLIHAIGDEWVKARDYAHHLDVYDDVLGKDGKLSEWQFALGGGFKEKDGADLLELPLDELVDHCADDVRWLSTMVYRTQGVWGRRVRR